MNRPGPPRRCLIPALLALALAVSPPLQSEIRLLVPGATRQEPEKDRQENALAAALDAAGAREVEGGGGALEAASLRAVDAVLLDDRSLAAVSSWTEGSVEMLAAAVQAGTGLVVAGEAAGALPGSSGFAALLGRKAVAPNEPPAGQGLLAAFPDQSHPITQCLTHVRLAGASSAAEAGPQVETLAVAAGVLDGPRASLLPKASPVLWARQDGRGRVLVLALRGRPADPQARRRVDALLSVIAGRGIQWVAGRPISVRLPGDLPLAAAALGPADAGILPGVQPIPGFFRCRQIAPVMSFHGADWLERADREATEEPERVLDSLALEMGSTVADVGAGTGYFTVRMARRVGPAGKVLAIEVQEEMLQLLREKTLKEGLQNIVTVLATSEDPRLPADSMDLALLVDVYHELEAPAPVVAGLRKGLRAGGGGRKPGRLVLVEYRGEDPAVPIKPLHRMTLGQVRAEIEPQGFRWLETKEFLRHQRIIVFERSAP